MASLPLGRSFRPAAADRHAPTASPDAPQRPGPGHPPRRAASGPATPSGGRSVRPGRSVRLAAAAAGSGCRSIGIARRWPICARCTRSTPTAASVRPGSTSGTNVTAGLDGFFFDPFEFYDAELVENPNVIVTGTIGSAKSGTVKALIKRSRAVYPDRFIAVIDPKGEYTALAEWLGIPVIKLHPGGRHQLNPMEADGDGDPDDAVLARQGLGRPDGRRRARPRRCAGVEEAVVSWAVARAVARGGGVHDPRSQRRAGRPGRRAVADRPAVAVGDGQDDVRRPFRAGTSCATARLRGMFDAPTNVDRRLASRTRRRVGPVGDPQRPAGAAAGHAGRLLLAGRGDAPTRAARSCR